MRSRLLQKRKSIMCWRIKKHMFNIDSFVWNDSHATLPWLLSPGNTQCILVLLTVEWKQWIVTQIHVGNNGRVCIKSVCVCSECVCVCSECACVQSVRVSRLCAWVLTHEQHMRTMMSDWMMPAVPTIQVSRRNRITPKMFCRQGRYTPIRVPMLGACWRGEGLFIQQGCSVRRH